jgi:hypothetical protein
VYLDRNITYLKVIKLITATSLKKEMSQQLEESMIVQGYQGKYYILNGYNYDIHFPYEWAINDEVLLGNDEFYSTGPEKCANCYIHGSRNGVFIGYCYNCGFHIHQAKRNFLAYDAESIETNERLWEELPYLNGVDINQIGNKRYTEIKGCAATVRSLSDLPTDYFQDDDDDDDDDSRYNYSSDDDHHDDYDEDEEDKRGAREHYEIYGCSKSNIFAFTD